MSGELLIELKPIGINITGPQSKPLLLLKDSSGDLTMPLPISSMDAGVLMQQTGKGATLSSPHLVTEQILKLADLKLERCVFTEMKSSNLMARLEFSYPGLEVLGSAPKSFEMKAEAAVALCLYLSVPLFATRELIWKARNQAVELQEQSEMMLFQTAAIRPHHYLM